MNNIISFFGGDHKCGTGMLSQCVAERIAAVMPRLKLLLIHTNGRLSAEYSPTVNESMDSIRPYLSDRLLDPDETFEKSRWKDNLHIISGARELGSGTIYDPEMTRYFLSVLRTRFDLILCDSGAEIEHGLSLGSLLSSDYLYLVITQSECAIRNYEFQAGILHKLQISANYFVINKFDKNNPYNNRYIQERLNMDSEKVLTVRLSEYGTRAEYDERSLVNYPGTGFRKDIDAIALRILEDTGIRMSPKR